MKSFSHLINWLSREKAFAKFLRRYSAPLVFPEQKGECWCVVQPWLHSAVPWFVITVALGLSQREWRVRVVWDDTGFGPNTISQRMVQGSISRVLKKLPHSIRQTWLSKVLPAEDGLLSKERLQCLVNLNTVWRYRCESPPPSSMTYSKSVEESLRRTDRKIKTLVHQHSPKMVFVPGGIYGSSGLFMELRRLGIRVATFDSGPGILLACTDGIAAHLDDIPTAFQLLSISDDWVVTAAQSELERRKKGSASESHKRDPLVCQATSATGRGEPVGILMPLNQSYDAAALGKHRVFKGQTEWMLETVAWSLENTNLPIVVRRHPVERIKEYTSLDDYRAILSAKFGQDIRIRYVSEDTPINTYDLINNARVIVPYTSTVGVEAAAMGKPVVTESNSYYADLGFVWSAKTHDQYFKLLTLALEGNLTVDETKRHDAWKCYYLTQCCNFVYSLFTPMPEDYDKWVRMNPAELFSMPEVSDVIESLDAHLPLAIVRHNRLRRQRQSETLQRIEK